MSQPNNNNNNNNKDHFGFGISIPVTLCITIWLVILCVLDYNDYYNRYSVFELYFKCSFNDDDDTLSENRTVQTSFPLTLSQSNYPLSIFDSCIVNNNSTLALLSLSVRKAPESVIKLSLLISVAFTFIMYSICRIFSWSETRLRQRRHYSRVAPTLSSSIAALNTISEHGDERDLELDEIENNINKEEKQLHLQKVVIKQDPVKIQQLLRSATVSAVVAGFEGRR